MQKQVACPSPHTFRLTFALISLLVLCLQCTQVLCKVPTALQ